MSTPMTSDQHAQLLHSMVAIMERKAQLLELDESFQLYKEQVEQYFFAKGVYWKSPELTQRILAVTNVDDFFIKFEREFVPADLQERLREEMNNLRERDCRDLPDYVGKSRHVVTQVLRGKSFSTVAVKRCQKPLLSRWTLNALIHRDIPEEPRTTDRSTGRTKTVVNIDQTIVQSQWTLATCRFRLATNVATEICALRAQRSGRNNQQHVNSVDSREDEQERIIYDRATISAVEAQKKTEIEPIGLELSSSGSDMPAQSRLLVRDEVIGNKSVKILINSARRFDGTWTSRQATKRVEDTIRMEVMEFPKMQFTEWDLPDTHDLIFGQSWFTKYNPKIDWCTQQIEVADHTKFEDVECPTFQEKMKKPLEIPQELKPVLDEYKDVFPEQLPNEMPPTRSVNFEFQMKPDAVPSSRAPFRLSKVEQDALQQFVEENIRKGWIEVSKSPCVSNIFGIPKKNLTTGKFPRRDEWLRSGNSKIPIRWVIDYRYVNSMSIVAKILLP
uniref:Retrotransposon protein putative n=1 Tax=Albugo laibachii Nc14 TaxID=890382 RepID=F0WX12_9STRA|nr:retrotransposon protein putative [Albugo laibachii Nc14]|eukprot:CCA26000.1 retrotransposon protein putative [Albugo laibachii Nc14]